MKEVQLTRGKVAIVDDEDFPLVSAYRWAVILKKGGRYCYAYTTVDVNGKKRPVEMQRFLMGSRPGVFYVDHINGDGLDNRRCNLRWATAAQNQANQRRTRGSSVFKGVGWHKGKWQARIRVNQVRRSLGRFYSEVEAAKAYDAAAVRAWGEFAATNFKQEV